MKKLLISILLVLLPYQSFASLTLPNCVGGIYGKIDWSFFLDSVSFEWRGKWCERKIYSPVGSFCISAGNDQIDYWEPIGIAEQTQKKGDLQCYGSLVADSLSDDNYFTYQTKDHTYVNIYMVPLGIVLGDTAFPVEPGVGARPVSNPILDEFFSFVPTAPLPHYSNSQVVVQSFLELPQCILTSFDPANTLRDYNINAAGCKGSMNQKPDDITLDIYGWLQALFGHGRRKIEMDNQTNSGDREVSTFFKDVLTVITNKIIGTATSLTIKSQGSDGKCGPLYRPYGRVQTQYYIQLLKPYALEPVPMGISELEITLRKLGLISNSYDLKADTLDGPIGEISENIQQKLDYLKDRPAAEQKEMAENWGKALGIEEKVAIIWRRRIASATAYYSHMTLTRGFVASGSPCH